MIEPDSKDWTWVLHRACPECGFDTSTTPADSVAELARANARYWQGLHSAGRITPGRPDPSTWSSLEYAAHVRDVHRRYRQRVQLMLEQDDPLYANWDQDATAVEDRYDKQDPTVVIYQLSEAAEEIAAVFDGLSAGQWSRPRRRSDGAAFTVATISRYMIHDPVHHLWDVGRSRST
jgi:hypothetical protein